MKTEYEEWEEEDPEAYKLFRRLIGHAWKYWTWKYYTWELCKILAEIVRKK